MIRYLFKQPMDTGDGKVYVEISCLSTDSKPTDGVAQGSILTEVDTGKVYFFNETAATWVEQFSFQS